MPPLLYNRPGSLAGLSPTFTWSEVATSKLQWSSSQTRPPGQTISKAVAKSKGHQSVVSSPSTAGTPVRIAALATDQSTPTRSDQSSLRTHSEDHPVDINGHTDEQNLLQERRDSSATASTSGTALHDGPAPLELNKAMKLIQSRNASPTLQQLVETFRFPLDDFQKEAIQEFLCGHSVLVCAPTGAGKTAIAEAATIATLAKGLRVIYTTPLKALSNQKLQEMREQFGHEVVGLQTGDVSLNAEGDVVIMTTEVLRNMLYRPGTFREDQTETTVQNTSDGVDRLARVGLIVLDEVHYLGNVDRGSVWEEAIISCHNHIPLLCMSATVSNPEDLGGWITKVHGSCKTVVTDYRPVPLHWAFCRNVDGKAKLGPLLDDAGVLLNSELTETITDSTDDDDIEFAIRRSRGRPKKLFSRRPENLSNKVPAIEEALRCLKRQKLLPVIWFAFSRQGCDTSALQLNAQRVSLVDKEESAQIAAAIEELRAEQPEAVREHLLPALLKGVSSHHAGCLPAWKSLIENLYRRGLIKVVFATGTLAAGINMPARSTVISTTSRRSQTGHIALPHNELLQMAGRAGRRGYDVEGHCVFLQDAYTHPSAIVDVLQAGPEPLQSHFSTGYGMVLKLLHTRTLDYARSFVQRSFYNYLVDEGAKEKKRTADKLMETAQELYERAIKLSSEAERTDDVFADYLKAKDAYQEQRKEHRKLFNIMLRQRSTGAVTALGRTSLPTAVGLELDTYDRPGEILPALLVANEKSGFRLEIGAHFLCLTADNRLLQIQASNIAAKGRLRKTIPHAKILPVLQAAQMAPAWKQVKTGVYEAQGSAKSARLATNLLNVEFESFQVPGTIMQELQQLDKGIAVARKEAERLQREASAAQGERLDLQLRAEATKLKRRAQAMYTNVKRNAKEDGTTWRSFENTLQVLVRAGALDPKTYKTSTLGSVARELNADNELWFAMVLANQAMEGISETTLAGVICAYVAGETNLRSNFFVKYECSRQVLEVIEALEPSRERLYNLQARFSVEANLGVDLRLSGIAEAWTAGASWEQITGDCNMEGGDIARLLSRTLDLLKQSSYCSALSPIMRDTARAACKGMSRKPITDLVA